MNKTELVHIVAKEIDMPLGDVAKVVDVMTSRIIAEVLADGKVQLGGLGSFTMGSRAARAARAGRNPATGEALQIPACKTVRFVASKPFKDLILK